MFPENGWAGDCSPAMSSSTRYGFPFPLGSMLSSIVPDSAVETPAAVKSPLPATAKSPEVNSTVRSTTSKVPMGGMNGMGFRITPVGLGLTVATPPGTNWPMETGVTPESTSRLTVPPRLKVAVGLPTTGPKLEVPFQFQRLAAGSSSIETGAWAAALPASRARRGRVRMGV